MGLIVSGRERARCNGALLSCGRLTPFLSPPEQQQLGARLTLSIVNGLCLIFACLLIGYGVTGSPCAMRQRMPFRAASASTRVMVSLSSRMPCSPVDRDPLIRWSNADAAGRRIHQNGSGEDGGPRHQRIRAGHFDGHDHACCSARRTPWSLLCEVILAMLISESRQPIRTERDACVPDCAQKPS